MTLVKTKHRPPAHHKKVTGEHHRKSQRYVKTYWPYLPIVLILGGAFFANKYLPASLNNSRVGAGAPYSTRIEGLIGVNSAVILDLLYLALVLLGAWYIVRHFKRIKSLLLESEQYLTRHYFLDIAAGALIGGLYILVH